MFRPVGSEPPSVYWRRRLVVFASIALLLILLVVTLRTVLTSDSGPTVAGGSGSASSTPSTRGPAPKPSTTAKSATPSRSRITPKPPSTSAKAPAKCVPADLDATAVVAASNYQVGDKPVVELRVTNTGSTPCVQNLADSQIEFKVYNGESRVWGSHDCEIQSGTDERTLMVGRAINVSVTWSGLTSRPQCAGTRQRVGAGTYTLYAVLSGTTGKATQFSIG